MRLIDLRTAFVVVAVIEAGYGAAGLLIPPSMIGTVLGWDLSPDGQWVAKLLGLALLTQAAVAWALRRRPPVAVAWIFAGYQAGAATVDWTLWLLLADEGVFASQLAKTAVIVSIVVHYAIAVLLAAAAIKARRSEIAHA